MLHSHLPNYSHIYIMGVTGILGQLPQEHLAGIYYQYAVKIITLIGRFGRSNRIEFTEVCSELRSYPIIFRLG